MDILDEAREAVMGPRQTHYGHPSDNHACTAALFTAYVQRRFGVAVQFDGRDVCWFDVLQKISRDANARVHDNLVDVIGYATNAWMIDERERGGTGLDGPDSEGG